MNLLDIYANLNDGNLDNVINEVQILIKNETIR